jgi:hypothetical protein
MKKRVLSEMAALVILCLFAVFSQSPFKNFVFTRNSVDSRSEPRRSYIARRQWLADTRTIVAAIRYLYESRNSNPINLPILVNIPHWLLRAGIPAIPQPDLNATNLQGAPEPVQKQVRITKRDTNTIEMAS